jgi:ribosomal protein S18 acetylase RimI-like enzyme
MIPAHVGVARNTKSVVENKMKIKVYRQDQFSENMNEIVSAIKFFGYGNEEWCQKVIPASQLFALAYIKGEFAGFGRTVGDGVRFSYIVDLNVRKRYQHQGIGTKLVQTLAKNSNSIFVELTNDPQFPWLEDFYKKAGFKLSEGEHVFEWPQKNENKKDCL